MAYNLGLSRQGSHGCVCTLFRTIFQSISKQYLLPRFCRYFSENHNDILLLLHMKNSGIINEMAKWGIAYCLKLHCSNVWMFLHLI